ncbi:glycosyltransferase [Chitinophaga lutea]
MNHPAKDIAVSVIICCYNGAERLPDTLRHLAAQRTPEGFAWEIILADNASTDGSARIAQEIWQAAGPSGELRIVEEPKAGQMYARRTGVKAARAECIIFCDDDNWLHEDYVYLAKKMMDEHPEAGAGGGQNHPVTDAPAWPDWFDHYKDKYATGVPASASGDVTFRGFVLGAGMVTRRSLFLHAAGERYPSLLNGRDGGQLSTGDDFEYVKRLLLRGYTLYYEAGMRLEHFIPEDRLTIAYRDRLMEGIRQATQVLDRYDDAIRVHRRNARKNRWRLLLLTPFRIFLARIGWSSRVELDERLTWFYLSPFTTDRQPEMAAIKRFIYKK